MTGDGGHEPWRAAPAGALAEPWRDPEEADLLRRIAEAEATLVDAEVALETLRVHVDRFAHAHHERLGPLYQRIDELDALIAEAVAARSGDPADVRRAWEARALVDDLPDLDEFLARAAGGSGGAAGGGASAPPAAEAPGPVRPSKQAQRRYRELARMAHPDLARDPDDERRRSAFMARVNEAYARGDVAELERLAGLWREGGAAAAGGEEPAGGAPAGGPAPWAGTSRALMERLEWLVRRIDAVDRSYRELSAGPIGELLALAPDDPDGLLLELADTLLAQVRERERRLAELLATP
ncbi:hypothetical protein [Allostreptomyces psammosilenae]|uniref:J domain-containing protein n=1 Tax=Allostreptomyces psammosilenae TaxID=1892865 RepID=A0A853A3U3_9ACTN|nr:hypothetical protein [Allostreptomyces psammosilenae]NYI05371.1 hypothetical protein [Allostreptomyces psammosilenae]